MTDSESIKTLEDACAILTNAQLAIGCGPQFILFFIMDARRYLEDQMEALLFGNPIETLFAVKTIKAGTTSRMDLNNRAIVIAIRSKRDNPRY